MRTTPTLSGSPRHVRRAALGFCLAAGAFLGGCARTVNDHLREAESGAPDAVANAVAAVSDLLVQKESSGIPFDEGDRAAVEYLERVALESPIPTIRAESIRGLGRLKTHEAKATFLRSLEDTDWLSRLMGVQAIQNRPKKEYARPLRDLLSRETRVEVRVDIVKTLGTMGGPVALKTLYETYLRRSSGKQDEKIHAYQALRELTGLAFSFDDHESWEQSFKKEFQNEESGEEGAGS